MTVARSPLASTWVSALGCLLAVSPGCFAPGGRGAFQDFEGLFREGRQVFYESLRSEFGASPVPALLPSEDVARLQAAQVEIPFLYEDLINMAFVPRRDAFRALIARGDPASLEELRLAYLELCREAARQLMSSLSSAGDRDLAPPGGSDKEEGATLEDVLRSLRRYPEASERPSTPAAEDLRRDVEDILAEKPLAQAGFEAALGITRAEGTSLAIISSGIDLAHPVFVNTDVNLEKSFSFIGRTRPPWEREQVPLTDFDGRGTAMASVVSVLAPAAELRIYRIGHVPDDQSYWAAMQLAQAIRLAAMDGADVITLDAGFAQDYPFLREACQFAYERGATIVAPNPSGDRPETAVRRLFPAQYSSTIAVAGAVEGTSGRLRHWDMSLPRHATDVTAPAAARVASPGIGMTAGDTHLVVGSHIAAAVAASLVALVQSRIDRATDGLPGKNFQRVYEIVVSTCDPARLGARSFTPAVGYGLINAEAAVGNGLAAYQDRMNEIDKELRRRREAREEQAGASSR